MLDANVHGCSRIASRVAAARSAPLATPVRSPKMRLLPDEKNSSTSIPYERYGSLVSNSRSTTCANRRDAGPFSGAMIRSSSNARYTNWFDSLRMTERVYSAGVCPGSPFTASAATTITATAAPSRPRHGEGRSSGTITAASTGLLVLAAVMVPLLLPSPWRGRLGAAVAVIVVAALAVNGLPGQTPAEYTRSVIRNESNQFVYRAFELDRIMAPENGPASRRLAHVVERELLTREPYRSYGIDVDEFFSSGSNRIFGDLTGVASGADLAAATREAIREHPGTFASSIARTLWEQLASRPVYAPEAVGESEAQGPSGAGEPEFVVVNGRRLPKPSEGQPIPASEIGPLLWTPGGTAEEVWTSPTEHHFVFSDPRDERRYEKLGEDVGRFSNRLPTRDGAQTVIHRLNQASHRFPPLLAFLAIGAVAFALRRPRNELVALAPAVAGLVVIVATALVAPAVAEYAAPVSPAFVLLAAVGLVGVPLQRRHALRKDSWRPLAGLAVGAVAAAWAVWLYV